MGRDLMEKGVATHRLTNQTRLDHVLYFPGIHLKNPDLMHDQLYQMAATLKSRSQAAGHFITDNQWKLSGF